MMMALRQRFYIVLFGMCAVVLTWGVGWADVPRFSGKDLDAENRLLLQQEANFITVMIVSRTRTEGALPAPGAPVDDPGRVTNRVVLAHVWSEILKPAAPNYLRNPGQTYRITIEGVGVEPPYTSKKDVDAADARDYVYSEFAKLRDHSGDLKREAFSAAGGFVVMALSDAGFLPAEIPLTQMKSNVGKTRVKDKGLQRQSIPKGAEPSLNEPEESEKSGSAGGKASTAGRGSAAGGMPRRPGAKPSVALEPVPTRP